MAPLMNRIVGAFAEVLGVCRRRALIVLGGTVAGLMITAVNTEVTRPAQLMFQQGSSKPLVAPVSVNRTTRPAPNERKFEVSPLRVVASASSQERGIANSLFARSHGRLPGQAEDGHPQR